MLHKKRYERNWNDMGKKFKLLDVIATSGGERVRASCLIPEK